jgi:Acetoacetate decarboxylase (ADC)
VHSWPPDLRALQTWLPGWPEPPWRMRGTTVTAWFVPPGPHAEALLGPLRDDCSDRWGRVRFYAVQFSGPSRSPAIPREGEFREAVVALPARVGGVQGEISAFMWTDSDTYLSWGREAFGWPLRRASFEMSGGAWSGSTDAGTGHATCDSLTISIELTGPATGHDVSAVVGSGTWITPRLIIPSDPSAPGRIEINAVTPRIVVAGVKRPVQATVGLATTQGHPLHGLAPCIVRAELHTGFEIVVGESVRLLSSYSAPSTSDASSAACSSFSRLPPGP